MVSSRLHTHLPVPGKKTSIQMQRPGTKLIRRGPCQLVDARSWPYADGNFQGCSARLSLSYSQASELLLASQDKPDTLAPLSDAGIEQLAEFKHLDLLFHKKLGASFACERPAKEKTYFLVNLGTNVNHHAMYFIFAFASPSVQDVYLTFGIIWLLPAALECTCGSIAEHNLKCLRQIAGLWLSMPISSKDTSCQPSVAGKAVEYFFCSVLSITLQADLPIRLLDPISEYGTYCRANLLELFLRIC